MSNKHRAQILLDKLQHKVLAEIAEQRGSSISGIVREAVDEWLVGHGRENERRKRLQALELVRQHRQVVLDRREGVPLDIDSVVLLHQIREERTDELINGTIDKGD